MINTKEEFIKEIQTQTTKWLDDQTPVTNPKDVQSVQTYTTHYRYLSDDICRKIQSQDYNYLFCLNLNMDMIQKQKQCVKQRQEIEKKFGLEMTAAANTDIIKLNAEIDFTANISFIANTFIVLFK
jgi:hypothetical protein